MVVDGFDHAGDRVPLDVERLAGFLAAEVGRRRLEIVVVGLPDQRRPGRMAHPQQHAAAVLAPALEDGAVAVVGDPLRELRKLLSVSGFAECLGEHCVEALRRLGRGGVRNAAERVVVQSVQVVGMGGRADRLHAVFAEGAHEVLVVHDGRHSALAVHLVVAVEAEVGPGGHGPVGTAAAHRAGRGIRDVVQARMLARDHLAQEGVDLRRRVAFVAAHINGD